MIAPVKIGITHAQHEYIRSMARLSELGGKSAIRGIDRAVTLGEDQETGHLAEAALHLYWFGHITNYAIGRWYKNQYKDQGDGGSDIHAMNLDVKGSLLRTDDRPLTDYHLCVRPNEMHDDWVYILALVHHLTGNKAVSVGVYLMGWASSDMFGPAEETGAFMGAHVLKADKLHSLMPIRHTWR